MKLNWVQKIAQRSGYLVPEAAHRITTNWLEREAKVAKMQEDGHKEAQSIAKENGHELSPKWNTIGANHCVKCGQQAFVRVGDWYDSLAPTKITGSVLSEKCQHELGDVPFMVRNFDAARLVDRAYPCYN